MNQINNIRFLKRTQGKTYKEVGEITGVSYKIIKKYEELEDLTPKNSSTEIVFASIIFPLLIVVSNKSILYFQ